MNKPAMTAMRNPAQAGFTLIELIVVIVILGILAATALPKFTNLGGDARAASINAAAGAMKSAVAIARGQALVKGTASAATVALEGVTVNMTNGYPSADTNFTDAAGLNASDYKITRNTSASDSSATATVPAIPGNGLVVQPVSVSTNATGLTCYASYKEAAAGGAPVVTVVTTNCQ